MCGIVGIIRRTGIGPSEIDLVARMNAVLEHRGPDGSGEFHDQHVALAMRRLSIIDLVTGAQPLYNEDRSLILVCNGEIYNFVELRQQLEARGHRFATKSDCEAILHLYEEHGDDCVRHLRGMFAFALWDARKRRLLLARDRMGEKPLYLAEKDDCLIFSSELKAMVRSGAVPFKLDSNAIHLYFHYGYVPDPRTAIRGVRKLPAAHTLSIDHVGWRTAEKCYWRMEDAPPIDANPAERIREELERIAELIIRSDVPVGIALSGGLDSSAIACLTAKKYPGVMQAISVGYAGRPIQDERKGAKELADHLKMPFHEVELTSDDLVELLRRIPYECDDPIGDTSGVSYYAVMKKAKELGVPVMLSGHGGDELFWGYNWVRQAVHATNRKQAMHNGGNVRLRDYLKISRPPYRSYTAGLTWLKSFGGLRTGWQQYNRDQKSPRDQMVFYDLELAFRTAADTIKDYYADRFIDDVDKNSPFSFFTIPQPWPAIDLSIMRLICQTYMIQNGLAQGDRLSMASSVELRLPLVDYRLVEVVVGLRKVHPDHDLMPKHWFRRAIQDVVPSFVMSRPKRGFSIPWREWNSALYEAYGNQLADGYLVNHHVLSGRGAAYLARNLRPRPFRMPVYMTGRALRLEMWCRQMSSVSPGSRT